MKTKFRIIYIPGIDGNLEKSVVKIMGDYYSVIGNGSYLQVSSINLDWGKHARWGKYIKI